MIPELYIEQWKKNAPWVTLSMVEQDMIISRALIALYNQPKVCSSLAFRGGTALNKLFIKPAARYSEDLDFVQIVGEPIGETIDAIRSVLDDWLGDPKRKITERGAKLIYRYAAIDKTPAKLKIEINTTEHFQVEPLQQYKFSMSSEWFHGDAPIISYALDELMGTKLRALYQRRKSRDLFDLWFVLDRNLIDTKNTIGIFEKYCGYNKDLVTRAMFEKSLYLKKQALDFQSDVKPLLALGTPWNFSLAVNTVEDAFIKKLRGEPWKG